MIRLDESEVYRFWDIFKPNNELVEVRLIGSNKTASGYFTDPKVMIDAIKPYTDSFNVYFTINRIKPACYGREQRDKIVMKVKNTTSDSEIEAREFVLVDLDAKRLSGVCATKEEATMAYNKGNEVRDFLIQNGFYDPIVVFSSSGIHLYLKCALINSDENTELIKRFLYSLSMIFSDEYVDVDVSVYNAARISRLIGSYSCKGSNNDPTRPQRKCRFLHVPDSVKVNNVEYFKKIADLYPKEEEAKPNRYNNYSTERFSLDAFIEKHNIPVTRKVQVVDGTRYYLEHCLFNEQHKGKDAILFQHNNGAVAYFCYHASCSGNDWHKVREMYEPDAYAPKPFDPNYRKDFRVKREFQPIVQTKEKGEVWLKMSSIAKPKFDVGDYIPSGVKQIDDLMIGFKRKHVTVWSGYRGCGKSSLLNMLILNGANYGYKSALWTGELDAAEEKSWLYMQAAGKQCNKETKNGFYYTPENICDKIDPWIDKYFWIFNNEYGNNFGQILDKARELKRKENIDFIILDNLMTLDIDDMDGDKNDRQKKLMYALTCLAKELNIHIHIVAHPNKSGTFLRPNNISGSGHIPDLAQNVFILHRINRDFAVNAKDFLTSATIHEIQDSRCSNTIEICKCRDRGSAVDTFIKLYFEPESRRFKDSIAESVIYGWQDELGEISSTNPRISDFQPTVEEQTAKAFETSLSPTGEEAPF